MRSIRIRRDGGPFSSLEVFAQVAAQSPHQPLNIAQMRTRVRILDAIEKARETDGPLALEEAEYDALRQALDTFPWNVASPALLAIIDDVFNADGPAGSAKGLKTVK